MCVSLRQPSPNLRWWWKKGVFGFSGRRRAQSLPPLVPLESSPGGDTRMLMSERGNSLKIKEKLRAETENEVFGE